MLSKSSKLLAVSAISLYASSAAAFFDAEVLAGKRWYELSSTPKTNVASQEVSVAAHIDPIPLVPLAFGAKIDAGTLNKGDLSALDTIDTAAVFRAGIDIMAWVPLVPMITPYARLTVPVSGSWIVKGKAEGAIDVNSTAKISGFDLGVGVKYSPLPLVRLLLEYGRGMEKYQQDKVTVGGVSPAGGLQSYDLNSNAFQLGVEIGI